MDFEKIKQKLAILADSAKYDVSCSSSGSSRVNTGGIGNCQTYGLCHSFTPDGRCISLLKILMTNYCAYDCVYCCNRKSNDTPRARLTPDEICVLTIEFYRRNYIEGLFLSSAIEQTPDRTMELLTATVKKLREEYHFHGYIHLKGIPSASQELIDTASRYADRMSFNIEFPSSASLALLAPDKRPDGILTPMKNLSALKLESREQRRSKVVLPAGQTTQMIVGASPECDGTILRLSQGLYRKFQLKRVYYSAYIPTVPHAALPTSPPNLVRENRLYQADWLLRYYGFTAEEIAPEDQNLSLEVDPKCGWALRNQHLFPVEINKAPLETLLRVPGIGVRTAYRILQARRFSSLRYEDLVKMRVVVKRARHFITCSGHYYGGALGSDALCGLLSSSRDYAEQLSLFPDRETQQTALLGEL